MNSGSSSTKPRRRLWQRIGLGLLFTAALLGGIIALLLAIDRHRTRAEWEQYVAEARARGQKLWLKEFVTPVPASENFAAIPLFEELFTKNQAPSGVLALPGKPPKLSRKDGSFDLEEWHRYFVAEKLLPAGAAASDPAAMLQALDARFEKEWQQLREAAPRPQARFPVAWEKTFDAEMPHTGVIQAASKLCALRLRLQLARKDTAAAFEEWQLGWRLAQALREEPVLISFLVRAASLQMLFESVRFGISSGQWDAAVLGKMQAQLGSLRILEDYYFAVDSERGGLNAFYDQIMAGNFTGMPLGPYRHVPAGVLNRNRIFSNRYADETLQRIDLKQERISRAPRVYDPERLSRSFVQRGLYGLALVAGPVFETLENRALQLHTSVQVAITTCSLERYRLAQGAGAAYPDRIEVLVPDYASRVPHDVIDGEPLRYRTREDGTRVIYSIGQNAADDAGAVTAEKSSQKPLDWGWELQPGGSAAP